MESPKTNNDTLSEMDVLLYDWLNEPNEGKFERKFEVYFVRAFPALIRYLSYREKSGDVDLESVAQESLIKFFAYVGKSRREAAKCLHDVLTNLGPVFSDAFHVGRVRTWTGLSEAFRLRAMTFRISMSPGVSRIHVGSDVEEINNRIPGLQRQGATFLDDACDRLRSPLEGLAKISSPSTVAAEIASSQQRALTVLSAIEGVGREEFERLTGTVGVTRFVENIHFVTSNLPKIRVPTNGLLFEIAKNRYVDEVRKRVRRIEVPGTDCAGPDDQPALAEDVQANTPSTSGSEVESVVDESASWNLASGSEQERGVAVRMGQSSWDPVDLTSLSAEDNSHFEGPLETQVDHRTPEESYATNETFEKFLALLAGPVERAAKRLKEAKAASERSLALKRLEHEQSKYRQLEAILVGLGEGLSQEEVAAKLGLTRNQVKYAIESVRENFEQFTKTRGEGVSSLVRRSANHVDE